MSESIRVPDDAGEHAPALAGILRRIPPPWGRGLDIGPGWYALVVRLDQELASVAPDYEVHQVKEKFGELRYYVEWPPGLDRDTVLRLRELIRRAGKESERICEVCGAPAVPVERRHWWSSRCEACADPPPT